MKITDDIIAAIHQTINMFGSKSAFARRANVSVDTLRKHMKRRSKSITDETWAKIYPFIKQHLPDRNRHSKSIMWDIKHLSADHRVLLDAFEELPKELQEQHLVDIIRDATEEIKKRRAKDPDESANQD